MISRSLMIAIILSTPLFSIGCAERVGMRHENPLLNPEPMPQLKGPMCSDAIEWALRLQQWGAGCEADKAALKATMR